MDSLLDLESLPHENATQVKNKWGDVRRLVRESGAVVITDRSNAELVLVDVHRFQQLTERLRAIEEKDHRILDELNRQFDKRLQVLQTPDFGERIEQVLAARGKQKRPAKVGSF